MIEHGDGIVEIDGVFYERLGAPHFALVLNMMRDSKIEYLRVVAVFTTKEKAMNYLALSIMEESVRISGWSHSYRPDSILWWFNPPMIGSGIEKRYVDIDQLLPHIPLDPEPPTGDYVLPEA